MRVLGVDPGSRICGYGVLSVESGCVFRYIECGVLTGRRADPFEFRLAEISRCLAELIVEFEPDAVAVEDVFTRINARSALALAQARGSVVAVAGLAGLPVFSYPAPLVKRAVTGRGSAPKEQVARMVQALVGLERLPNSDAADALAVAITHAQRSDAGRVDPFPMDARP